MKSVKIKPKLISDSFQDLSLLTDAPQHTLVYDFGKKVTGYLHLLFAESTDGVSVQYGPVIDCFPAHFEIAPGSAYTGEHYIACRYVRISSAKAFKVLEVDLTLSQYPLKRVGSFSADDALFTYVWNTAVRTLELCAQKSTEQCAQKTWTFPKEMTDFINNYRGNFSDYFFFDGPRRDRELWLFDLRMESLAALTAFDDHFIVKNCLDTFYQLRDENGVMPGSAATHQVFLEFNLWWMISVWEYYLYTGDRPFIDSILPGLEKLLCHLKSVTDTHGLICSDHNWMWTLPREGCSLIINTVYVHALRCAAKIMHEYGRPNEETRLLSAASKTSENINKVFWDETKGVYFENFRFTDNGEKPIPLDANCFAVVFGIADALKAKRTLSYIKNNMHTPYGSTTLDRRIRNPVIENGLQYYELYQELKETAPNPEKVALRLMYPHNRQVWPFLNAYEAEARFLTGDVTGAMELIRLCWGNPAYRETESFWEMFDIDEGKFVSKSFIEGNLDDCANSAAHGFSAWISYIMQTYILGVKPSAPGFAEVIISPQTGNLNTVKGAVPTPRGLISVSIQKTPADYRLTVKKPADTMISIKIGEDELAGKNLKTETRIAE